MNTLSLERQAQILSALVEGNSVRSTSGMSGAHIGTILYLLVRAGNGCGRLIDETMQGFQRERLELDEIWAYAFSKKLGNLKPTVALHFAHYNLVRIHKTLLQPAPAANFTDRLWSMKEPIATAIAEME